jgi:hypothetical protein
LAGREGICPVCGKLLDVPGTPAELPEVGTATAELESPTPAGAVSRDAPDFDLGSSSSKSLPPPLPPDVVKPTYRLSTVRDVFAATFLFGPIGGVVLIAWNYLLLRRRRAFAHTLLAALGLAAVDSAVSLYGMPASGQLRVAVFKTVFSWVAVPFTAAALQGQTYKDHLARGGRQGPVLRTLVLGACGYAAWWCVFLAVAAIGGNVASDEVPKKLRVTPVETIYYSPDLPDEEARGLGELLKKVGKFTGVGDKTVRLTREGDGRRVWVILASGHGDPEVLRHFDRLRGQIAEQVFPGRPVELVLCDQDMVILQTLR